MDIKTFCVEIARWGAFFFWAVASCMLIHFNLMNTGAALFQAFASITFAIIVGISYRKYIKNNLPSMQAFTESVNTMLPWYGTCGFLYLIYLTIIILR